MSKHGLLDCEVTRGTLPANGQFRRDKLKPLEWVRASNEIPAVEFFGDRVGSLNLCKGVKKNSNSVKGSSLVGP